MIKIKARRGAASRATAGRFILLGIACAVIIRALAASGIEGILHDTLTHAAQNQDFLKFAIASETAAMQDFSPIKNAAANILYGETPFFNRRIEPVPTPTEEFKLIPWKFTPPPLPEAVREFPIKAISINPKSSNGYVTLGDIYLKNDSSKQIDLNSYLKADMPFSLKGDGPHVLIVHTHGSESYFPAGKYTYTPDDVERTQDKNYNVIRVGDEIEKILTEKGISVVHDRNIYDSPSYNGSYTRTLDAISAQMKKTPSIKVILDIHRDAMTSKDGVKYKTSATVNGKPSAQLMLVMSTGESGLPHPNWQENLKFAVKLQCRIVNKYPGLMRPINLRTERFNMHVTSGSMLVEVGTSANSLEEALTAVRPFSEELAILLNSVRKK